MKKKDTLLVNIRIEKPVYDELAQIRDRIGGQTIQDVIRFSMKKLIEEFRTTGILIKRDTQSD